MLFAGSEVLFAGSEVQGQSAAKKESATSISGLILIKLLCVNFTLLQYELCTHGRQRHKLSRHR